MQNRTALVVDDDPTARFLLRTALEKLGWGVVEAELGVDGLQQLRDVRPGLLFLDLLMPHMDGLDTLRYLRSEPPFDTLPVIVVSVLNEDHEIMGQLRQLGILRYFRKPLDPDMLLQELETLLAEPS